MPDVLSGEHAEPMSPVAGRIEARRLEVAGELLGVAREALDDQTVTAADLRELGGYLCEALGDALGIAASRGRRCSAPGAPGGRAGEERDGGGPEGHAAVDVVASA
jgi:hypothetical protein